MRSRIHTDAFSLIELLVSLSVLAIVAAIIVPKFLNVGGQAQQIALDQDLSTLNNAITQWQTLGGTFEMNDTFAAFHLIAFLSTPSDGTPTRGLGWNADVNTGQPYVQDSGNSGTICISAQTQGDTNRRNTKLTQASQPDGFYAVNVTLSANATPPSEPSNSSLYDKKGNQVIPIDFELASAVFIRTGTPLPTSTIDVGVPDGQGGSMKVKGTVATPGQLP